MFKKKQEGSQKILEVAKLFGLEEYLTCADCFCIPLSDYENDICIQLKVRELVTEGRCYNSNGAEQLNQNWAVALLPQEEDGTGLELCIFQVNVSAQL